MNQDQILGALRILLPTILAYAVGKGWLTSSQVADVTAGIVMIAGVAMSFLANTQHAKIAAVADMPEVKQIVTTKEIAQAAPSPKVTNGFVAPKPEEKKP
jgi:hypothetical protein